METKPAVEDEDSYYCESLGNYGGDSGGSPAKKSPLNKMGNSSASSFRSRGLLTKKGDGQIRSSKNEDALAIDVMDKQESIYMADKSPLQSDEHSSNLRLSAKSFRPPKKIDDDVENTDPNQKLDPQTAELVDILKVVNSSREKR